MVSIKPHEPGLHWPPKNTKPVNTPARVGAGLDTPKSQVAPPRLKNKGSMKEIHRQNERHRHDFVSIAGGSDWNKWCPECGAIKHWNPYGRSKYKRPKTKLRDCKKPHEWAGAYDLLGVNGYSKWDTSVSWCVNCGALKHDGCKFQHMAGFHFDQKKQIVPCGEMIDTFSVFNGEGLFVLKK